jgi:hypothetical protein
MGSQTRTDATQLTLTVDARCDEGATPAAPVRSTFGPSTTGRYGVESYYSILSPEIARLITSCWICSVPSKMS